MMDSGGDGGLALDIQMLQYKLLNEDNPCSSQAEADDIMRWIS